MQKNIFLIKFLSAALILLTAKVAFSQSVFRRAQSSIPLNSDVKTGCYIQRTDNINLNILCKKVIEPIKLTKQTKEDESKDGEGAEYNDELDGWAEETKYLTELNELKNRIEIRNRNSGIRLVQICDDKGKCSSIVCDDKGKCSSTIRNLDLEVSSQ
ncbi:hypothetical protein [Nostoc sp. 'Peltigera membranacea cyanobiont' 232]|uniref:hypothetical protein n=1 Tax=Nostoc sp. 'Peltigera membranacea cyanobiont' 232 TaxID=2014531 RepID=UPI000B952762|nr:hypothetical protein [Nostoc sp. 'Peltigera membranacea cyanobiont' 232]OYE04789.1 hypothetical protein CDG79_10945 [Nostoc sp. 'Peltigera membranacea cyanobiont' 232]